MFWQVYIEDVEIYYFRCVGPQLPIRPQSGNLGNMQL